MSRGALIVEIELPTFYAEDMLPDNADWRELLAMSGTDPEDQAAVGQAILGNIGEVYYGLLTVEVSGEKDSDTIRTPVLMVGARVEDREAEPESKWREALDAFEAHVDEDVNELREVARLDAALVQAYEPFVRWAAELAEATDHAEQPECFRRVVARAVEAMDKAREAEDAADATASRCW